MENTSNEKPRIENRSDALGMLEQFIKITKISAEAFRHVTVGLETLKEVMEKEEI